MAADPPAGAVRSRRTSGRPGHRDRTLASSRFFAGEDTRGGLPAGAEALLAEHPLFDEASGLKVYVPGFRQILKRSGVPFSRCSARKDSVVDWRSTIALYKETIRAAGTAIWPSGRSRAATTTCCSARPAESVRTGRAPVTSALRRLPGRHHHVDQGEGYRPAHPRPPPQRSGGRASVRGALVRRDGREVVAHHERIVLWIARYSSRSRSPLRGWLFLSPPPAIAVQMNASHAAVVPALPRRRGSPGRGRD